MSPSLEGTFVVVDGIEVGGAKGGIASRFLLPRENQDVEDEGAFEVAEAVDVTEDFLDMPIIGILLFSPCFSALLADLEPYVPREDILPDVPLVR